MHFDDLIFGEPGPLKVTVDVGGVDEAAVRHALGPAAQDAEAVVRGGLAVEVQTMAVEAPAQFGIVLEPTRIGHVDEVQAKPGVGWVSLPEALVASEIGQSRV